MYILISFLLIFFVGFVAAVWVTSLANSMGSRYVSWREILPPASVFAVITGFFGALLVAGIVSVFSAILSMFGG